jgi:hypothetical protein
VSSHRKVFQAAPHENWLETRAKVPRRVWSTNATWWFSASIASSILQLSRDCTTHGVAQILTKCNTLPSNWQRQQCPGNVQSEMENCQRECIDSLMRDAGQSHDE